MAMDLAKIAKERGIKYFLISYVDLFGTMRAKLVPAAAIEGMAKNGAGFAGFASWLDMTPADSDMLAVPDADSLMQLPWRKEVGWLAADCYMDGKLVEQAPRNVLKRAMAEATAKGYELKTGVECEFFLIEPGGQNISDAGDYQSKPCYDQQALMRRYDVITEICDSMLELGWSPYQNDHEDANGQFEMNWQFDNALKTADRHAFFKYMVKAIAEKHGLRATFMPKPFPTLTGNGCHAHVSLWSTKTGKNLFEDANGTLGLSPTAYQFIAGVMNSAEALTAITNPTVNSYKRINAVAEFHHLYRQQPHPHDPHPRARPLRVQARRRSGQPLCATGRTPHRRPRRHREEARSRRPPRHRHVCQSSPGKGRQAPAAQYARCAARLRAVRHPALRSRRAFHLGLSEAEACRLERICRAVDRVGAAHHARLLERVSCADR